MWGKGNQIGNKAKHVQFTKAFSLRITSKSFDSFIDTERCLTTLAPPYKSVVNGNSQRVIDKFMRGEDDSIAPFRAIRLHFREIK